MDEKLPPRLLAEATQRAAKVIGRYLNGMPIERIVDECGVTRTELAYIIRSSGAHRGMDAMPLTADDVANLYSMLYAAQGEIEMLRARIAHLTDND